MVFVRTLPEELEPVLSVIKDARARIGGLGIDQWQDGYPNREILSEDIRRGCSYVAKDDDGSLCGTCAIIEDGEPLYDRIYDGQWLSEGRSYVAVHRVAVSGAKLRRGVAGSMMRFAEQMARQRGMKSVRIDTHKGNLPMRTMLEKNGYVHCGTIYLETGEPRVAYEKLLG